MSGSNIVVDSTISVTDTNAELGDKKDAAGSFTGEIGVTKADAGNKEAGSITGDIDVTKAEVGDARKGVVTEVDCIEFVFPRPPVELLERKAEPTGALITKEMVPNVIIERLLTKRPFKKLPSTLRNTTSGYDMFPELRDLSLANRARWNYLVDLQADVVNQHKKKGFAEVGVDYTDGVKKIFILPQPQESQRQETIMQPGNGRGRSKTTLVFVSGFAIVLALFVVLLSCSILGRVSVQV